MMSLSINGGNIGPDDHRVFSIVSRVNVIKLF